MSRMTHFRGMQPVQFQHTAWDLALATQSLAEIEPALAYRISRVYTYQQTFAAEQRDFSLSSFTPAVFADTRNGEGLATAMLVHLNDVAIAEPSLLDAYAKLIPTLDTAIRRAE